MHRNASAARRPGRLGVTVVGPVPPTRGISPYVRSLVSELAANGEVDVEVLGFRSIYPRWLYPGGDTVDRSASAPGLPEGVRVRNVLAWWNPLGWLAAALSMRGDVVHGQWWSYVLAPVYVAVLLVARLRGKRVVLTVHNVAPHEGGLLRRAMNRSVLPLADVIVVHSEQNRAVMRSLAPRKPVRVVPHGVLPLEARCEDRRAVRERLGVPAGAEVVLAFGHLRPYKGTGDLLEAFARLRAERPSAHLLIAGEPWEPWEPYARRIEALGIAGAVTARLGFVPDALVPQLFAAADLVVLPYTHFDGQSGAGTLALSAGLPLVVTDVGGLPDLVEEPEAVVPPGDIPALERAMAAVLGDPELRAGLANGSRRKAREMSWACVAEATVEVYRLALGTGPAERVR